MSEKKCPYCGNPEMVTKDKDKFGKGSLFCPVCCYTVEKGGDISWWIFKHEDISKEVENFNKEYNLKIMNVIIGDPEKGAYPSETYTFLKHFLTKNDKGETIIDISEENIRKCEELYKSNPDNENNFLRLLLLKIFSGQECKDLTSIFLKKYSPYHLSPIFWELLEDQKFYEIFGPYLPQLRNFLLWVIDVNPEEFKKEVHYMVFDDEFSGGFFTILEIIGPSMAWKIIDFNRLYLEEIFIDTSYGVYYVVAESFYSEKKWLEAFLLFEKLRGFNELYKVTDEELSKEFKWITSTFSKVLSFIPTVEEIKNKSYESFCNLVNSGGKEDLYDFIKEISKSFFAYKSSYKSLKEEKDKEINNYLQIYNVFSELVKGNYSEAFKKWVSWDKSNITLIGLDIWAVTRSIMNLRDGVGSKEDNIRNLLEANPFVEDFGIVSDLEVKLRKFISESLTTYYGGEGEGWYYGVPEKIRTKCGGRKEQDIRLRNVPKYNLLDFSDYSEIICFRENWDKIFRKYFIFEKADSQKGKDKLTAFLRELVPLRNTVYHLHKVLEPDERKRLQEYYGHFLRIYKKWENTTKDKPSNEG